jgi:hypothetical protein
MPDIAPIAGMRGSRALRYAIRDHAKLWLPVKVTELAAGGGPTLPLPDDEEWHPAWVAAERITNWPAFMVVARTGRNLGRQDFVNGDPEYRWQWTVRSYLWARGETFEDTADTLEQLANAYVHVLLARPGLGDPGDSMYVATEEPMGVSLSSIEDDESASIAGAYVEFIVSMTETATIPPLATPGEDGLDLEVTVAPKDP